MNVVDQTGIYNMALAAVGVSRFIQSPKEQSLEAMTCNVFWDTARDQCLQEAPWGFAMRFSTLQLIDKVIPGWKFAYTCPVDCLQSRYIVGHYHWENIPFQTVEDELSGRLCIATNHANATLAYTARVTTEGLWSPTFVTALKWLLASMIVSPLSANPKYAETAGKAYEAAISKAAALSMNENITRPEPESELIRARG